MRVYTDAVQLSRELTDSVVPMLLHVPLRVADTSNTVHLALVRCHYQNFNLPSAELSQAVCRCAAHACQLLTEPCAQSSRSKSCHKQCVTVQLMLVMHFQHCLVFSLLSSAVTAVCVVQLKPSASYPAPCRATTAGLSSRWTGQSREPLQQVCNAALH